jgi:hypothetical protein
MPGPDVEVIARAPALQPESLFGEQCASRLHGHCVFTGRLRIHGDQEVNLRLPGNVSVLAGSDCEPGGQTCDIGWEKILSAHRNAHLEDRAHQHQVGRLTPGSVHGCDL